MDGADQKSIQDTLQYYDRNAREFINNTATVDFTATQTRFVSKLEKGSHILDFGCGLGRDTKYFLSQGFQVTATDGSVELCKLAGEYTAFR